MFGLNQKLGIVLKATEISAQRSRFRGAKYNRKRRKQGGARQEGFNGDGKRLTA